MELRLGIAAAVVLAAALIGWRLRGQRPEAPPRDAHPVPHQLDRADFPRADAPWLVAYFSSTTCAGCQGLAEKIVVLESSDVATVDCSFESQRDLHDRYDISAIPMILIADAAGVVHRAFIGHTTATDL